MGETCAVCQSVGTTPVSKDLLKMSNSVGQKASVLNQQFQSVFSEPSTVSTQQNYMGKKYKIPHHANT
jgi:hypothetical protein